MVIFIINAINIAILLITMIVIIIIIIIIQICYPLIFPLRSNIIKITLDRKIK